MPPVQSEGSGFIVRPDGYIFTNVHVIEDADKIDVKLQDGREFPARVVGADEKTDIAVIKIDAKNLPVVQLGDSDEVRVGQFAFAIGAPFKLDYTFTYGVISGKGRSKLFFRPAVIRSRITCRPMPPLIRGTAAVRCATSMGK